MLPKHKQNTTWLIFETFQLPKAFVAEYKQNGQFLRVASTKRQQTPATTMTTLIMMMMMMNKKEEEEEAEDDDSDEDER